MRGASNEFFDNINIMRSVCKGIIDERRAKPSAKNDLVDAMLHRKDPKTGEAMSDDNVTNNMITFLVAGKASLPTIIGISECNLLQAMKPRLAFLLSLSTSC